MTGEKAVTVMLSAAKHLQFRPVQNPFRFSASLRMTGEKAVTVMLSAAKHLQFRPVQTHSDSSLRSE
jgi:hypothetical protein